MDAVAGSRLAVEVPNAEWSRLARSWLFVPGSRPDRFEKALQANADAVVVDLEDAVREELKDEARAKARRWLEGEGSAYVRINPAQSRWFDQDLDCVARCADRGLRGVMLPKAETAAQVASVATIVPEPAAIVPLIETAQGALNASRIAAAPRVARLAFGSLDFALDAGVSASDDEAVLYVRSRLVLASRASEIGQPIDGVTVSIHDPDRVHRDALRARRLGFGAKLCIHPAQVASVNRALTPTSDELAWARRILEVASGSGAAAVVDGEMIDRPRIKHARSLVTRAELLGESAP